MGNRHHFDGTKGDQVFDRWHNSAIILKSSYIYTNSYTVSEYEVNMQKWNNASWRINI